MSVVEDLRGFERRVADRLRELEPLVEEYQELERIAERLGIDRARATTAAPKRAARPKPARRGARRAKRAAGKRKPEPAARPRGAKPTAVAARPEPSPPHVTGATAARPQAPVTAASTPKPTGTTPTVSDQTKPAGVTNGAKLAAPRRRDQLLALVSRKPGITVPEIAKQLEVDPTGLYRVVRQLERERVIKKHGMELRRA